MNILVINCGSSSLKYQLIDSETENVLAKGLCERIGIHNVFFQIYPWDNFIPSVCVLYNGCTSVIRSNNFHRKRNNKKGVYSFLLLV